MQQQNPEELGNQVYSIYDDKQSRLEEQPSPEKMTYVDEFKRRQKRVKPNNRSEKIMTGLWIKSRQMVQSFKTYAKPVEVEHGKGVLKFSGVKIMDDMVLQFHAPVVLTPKQTEHIVNPN